MARLLWTFKQHVGPVARTAHAATFDSRRSRVILFGGDSLKGAVFSDTWEWDGENWTQVADIGPGARFGAALAYDAARDRTVLFGGVEQAGNLLGDTWEWNGEDWTQMADGGPSARVGHAMAFDSLRNRVVLFGGLSNGTFVADTWEWDGDEWVQVEDTGPSPRRAHAMTFDAVRRRLVLFGGFFTNALGDTWEFDGATWTQMAAFGPPPCLGASLVHNGRRALLFGGVAGINGAPTVFHLTWEWDGRHWTVRQDLGPGDRWGHSMVFDTKRNRGVLFGGTASAPDAAAPNASGETWEQFEQGALQPPPPPPTDIQVQSVAVVPALPVEGEPLTLDAILSAAPPSGATVAFTLVDAAGDDVFGGGLQAQTNNSTTVSAGPLTPPAGAYTATASIGPSTQGVSFQVEAGANPLQSLTVSPLTASPGVPFTLTAVVSGTAGPAGITLPMMVSFQSGPDGLWATPPLQIPQGQVVGAVTIDPQIFGNALTGPLRFTGSLGGVTLSATVTLQ